MFDLDLFPRLKKKKKRIFFLIQSEVLDRGIVGSPPKSTRILLFPSLLHTMDKHL